MKTLKDKRGVVMEMAIIFIVIVSVMCTLLITVMLLINSNERTFVRQTGREFEIEKIRDQFVAGDEIDDDVYTINTSTNATGKVLIVYNSDGEKIFEMPMETSATESEATTAESTEE